VWTGFSWLKVEAFLFRSGINFCFIVGGECLDQLNDGWLLLKVSALLK
jgi:hypothetical protein